MEKIQWASIKDNVERHGRSYVGACGSALYRSRPVESYI